MMGRLLTPAAAALLRALIARSGVPRDRILLSSWTSTDWQSLTFVGERHTAQLRVTGPDSAAVAARIADGLQDAEFAIAGQIVADIAVIGLAQEEDGATLLSIEALTIAE
jgi:hypothetical protein